MIKFRALFIGCGNMGGAILDGILSKKVMKKSDIYIIEPDKKRRFYLEKNGLNAFDNIAKVNIKKLNISILLIAVKPQIVKEVVNEVKEYINTDTPIVSIVAGKKIKFFKNIFGNNRSIIRVMPNTPASYGKGVTAIFPCKNTTKLNLQITNIIFSAVGKVIILKQEDKMDIVTAVSGSGPAYVFLLIESLIKTAINNGLDKKTATILVKETLLGSSYMAAISCKTPEKLRIDVTSPGGVTEAALKEFNKNSIFFKTIERAIRAAVKKSITLSS